MNVDFWASRVHSANNFSVFQAARLDNSDNQLIMNDMGDDVRAWFPCPFCYVDIEVPMLCLHLQEEHCFDLKNAVCPICAANLGKDAIGHFTTQHPHSIKWRRKSQRSDLWNNCSMAVGKDMRDLNSYLGPDPMNRGSIHENTPDPLLSPFLFSSIPLSDPKNNSDDEISCNAASTTSEPISTKSGVLDEAQEQDYKERRQRAVFVQQLIFSTIF